MFTEDERAMIDDVRTYVRAQKCFARLIRSVDPRIFYSLVRYRSKPTTTRGKGVSEFQKVPVTCGDHSHDDY